LGLGSFGFGSSVWGVEQWMLNFDGHVLRQSFCKNLGDLLGHSVFGMNTAFSQLGAEAVGIETISAKNRSWRNIY
jgi:hypothetical protein